MTYVVTDKCIRCKYQDCIEVCPVDCFHAGENMLVIDPDVCIDCGVCEPECPIDAIVSDLTDEAVNWIDLNREYSKKWPQTLQKNTVPSGADEFKDVDNKFELYFSARPEGE